ncbi:MAG: GrpB family protein [Saprospiraceae bacterium]|nr:GrpB family protein [Saprospiraceae bacterium]
MSKSIHLEPYQNDWKTAFESLKSYYTTLLEKFAIDIHHVGSTSIPGLLAKPILDIDIVVYEKEELYPMSDLLVTAGYLSKGDQGIKGRYAFKQTSLQVPITVDGRKWMQHHLYLCFHDSLALKNHLTIKQALLEDMILRHRYALLKENLAADHQMTRVDYTIKKTDFILEILIKYGFDTQDIDLIRNQNT